MPRAPRKKSGDKFLGVRSPKGLPASTDVEQSIADAYSRLFEPLLKQARPFIGHDSACDAVNEVFLELTPGWNQLSLDERSPEAITALVHKRVWQKRKAEGRQISLDDEPVRHYIEATVADPKPPPMDPSTLEVDERKLLQGAFERVTTGQMQCWRLVKDFGYSAQAAADILGISVRTVYCQIANTKRAVRARIAENSQKISPETVRLLLGSRTGGNIK